MPSPQQNTFFALNNYCIQAGDYDPSVVATDGRAGSLFIQVHDASGGGSYSVWQKQDDGLSTNWAAFGGGGGSGISDYKDPVDTVNPIATNINLAAPGAVINGVVMAAGMSFLCVNQTLSEENGIYEWNGAAVPATRRADANTDAEVTKGMFTWVNDGPTQRRLTGWILSTANPITLGVTPLTFTQVPINASTSTRAPGIFFVASNGVDTNPSTRGAIAAPFATIQAAINQAVAEGYNQSNQLTVIVLPSSATYAGFSTSPGISVSGLAPNVFMPRVAHANIVPDGAGINSNTGCSISNLQLVSTTQASLNFPAGNQGRWTINNCRILNQTLGFNAVSMDNAGSVLNLENCKVVSESATPAISFVAGGNLLITGGSINSQAQCIVSSGGAVLNAKEVDITSTSAADYAVDNSGIGYLMDCRITNIVTGGGAIARVGSSLIMINCAFNMSAGNIYEVELGATISKSLLTITGPSNTVVEAGNAITLPLRGVGYDPAIPSNYPGTPPSDMKPALDELAAMTNYANARKIFVDAVSGSDVTGTGAQLRPYQSIQAALAAIALLAPGDYVLELASGDYGGAAIAWPSQSSGYNVSMNGSGLTTTISADITLTSGLGANEQIVWQNLGKTNNPIVFDLALATIATVILANGGFSVDRIDTLPAGPQVVRIWNAIIGSISTASSVLVTNGQWVGGPPNVIAATGQLLLTSCLAAAMTFQVDGTMQVISSITNFSTFSGAGTLSMDASSKSYGPAITTANQVLADYSPTQFTFQPGGVADFANRIFTTWADLYAAVQLVDGPKTVLIDDSIVTPAVIPAGAYALPEVTLDNARPGQFCGVQIADGVSWTGLVAIKNMSADFLNSAVVESLAARAMLFEGATINALGTAPIWEVPAGAQFQADKGSFFNGIPASPIVDVLAGQNFIMVLTRNSALNTVDCISGTLTSTLQNYLDASGVTSTQAAFAGAQSDVLVDNSSRVAYSPAVPADWIVVPTEVKSALDELAARVTGAAGFSENAYFVAENGSDVTGDGSYQKPFATIQAAINQAAADGHDFADQANILVMPSSAPYAGFTAQNGINVVGLASDNRSVIVGAIDVTFDGSGFATNSITIANLTVSTAASQAVEVGVGNAGTLTLRYCRLIMTGGFSCALINNAGAYVEFDDCYVDGGGQTALQIAAGSVAAWNTSYFISSASAVVVQGGDFFGEYCSILSTGGGAAALDNQSGSSIVQYSKITNSSAAGASPAISVAAGSVTAESCVLSAAGANENVDVAVGATFTHSLCTFAGASASFANAGTITTLGVFKMRPGKETITLDAGDIAAQFVDLAEEVTPNSMTLLWSFAQPPLEGPDYTLSTVGGVTRITFVPGGVLNTLAAAGQVLQPGYLY